MNYISCPGIGGRRANRIIFYIMCQRWPLPDHVIDHIDRDPSNNRWSNLRECTSSQNAMNCDRGYRRLHATDELLEAGVRKDLRTGKYVELCARSTAAPSHRESRPIRFAGK